MLVTLPQVASAAVTIDIISCGDRTHDRDGGRAGRLRGTTTRHTKPAQPATVRDLTNNPERHSYGKCFQTTPVGTATDTTLPEPAVLPYPASTGEAVGSEVSWQQVQTGLTTVSTNRSLLLLRSTSI